MKRKILEILGGHLIIDYIALKKYLNIANVRLGITTNDLQEQIGNIISNRQHLLEQVLLGKENSKWLDELKLLDAQNRKHALENYDMPDAYHAYLTSLNEEIENPKLNSPTLTLQEAEQAMYEDFSNRKFADEDFSAIEGLDVHILRIILQESLLYPELICNKENLDLMLYLLEFTGIEL